MAKRVVLELSSSTNFVYSLQPPVQLVVWFCPSKGALFLLAPKGGAASIVTGPLIKRYFLNLLFLIPLLAL